MRPTGIDDVGVDFVGHHHQIVADGELRHRLQFRPAEGAPSGVLRMAEDHHAYARIGGCFIRAKIEDNRVPSSRIGLAIRRRPVSSIARMKGG